MSKKSPLDWKELIRFYLPLAGTSLMMTLTHIIMDAGLARTRNPNLSLAAFAVAKSIVTIIVSPQAMNRQMTVALVRTRKAVRVVKNFVTRLALAISLAMAICAFTPLSLFIFERMIGVPLEVAEAAQSALKIMSIIPLCFALRDYAHGLAILSRQNPLIPLATITRLGALGIVLSLIIAKFEWPGAVIAATAYLFAAFVEMSVVYLGTRDAFRFGNPMLTTEKKENENLTLNNIFNFMMPLTITTLILSLIQPIINATLARGATPELSLAAYAVAYNLGGLFFGPITMIHQCSLVYINDDHDSTVRTVRSFITFCGFVAGLGIMVTSLSPLGTFIFRRLIGVETQVAKEALRVLLVLSFYPIFSSWKEFQWGMLFRSRETGGISKGKFFNFLVMLIVLSIGIAGQFIPAAMTGALSLVGGEAAEAVYLYINSKRIKARI